ncbi:VWA domain-containing protein [Microbacterium sp. KUDC0406]|uniref:vWA domain-containing protein n=1 Tax=Microbacterium sp. KUDC0406 TaxID=2909588 RepID=UPI001F30ABAD|nr:vWA domain-containing protein [Microbacterium sp. KUDC0406]UJP10781.1 VWA domain-containing protein [Microbacterium sp. KUDC0406]
MGGPAAAEGPLPNGVSPTEKLADYASWHRYPGSLPDSENPGEHLSLNAGRIWTDKTVLSDDDEAADADVDHDLDIADDEMAVVLSALGTTRQVTSTRKPVIDLVLVLDNSYSMTQCVGSSSYCNSSSNYTNSRAYAMVQGVNAAINYIVEADPDARVSMVAFGTGATTLTDLAKPSFYGSTGEYASLVFQNNAMTIRTAGSNLQVGTVSGSTQSTNIQRGVDRARAILAGQDTSDVAGEEQHIPSVILFSDGEPTFSANDAQWWNLRGSITANQGPGSPTATQYYGNGFLAAMSAAYLKNQVTDVYNDESFNTAHGFSPIETNIYTVGLGMSALQTQGRQLAYATLDPRGTLPASGQTSPDNAMATSFAGAMTTFAGGGVPNVLVNSSSSFRVNQPTGVIGGGSGDVDAIDYSPSYDELRYNTTFDAPNTAAELVNVFERIASQVVEEEPTLPIETTTPDPNTDGYVTFTDPLGQFMRVSKMDSIVFCSVLQSTPGGADCDPTVFAPTGSSTEGNTTTYTFTGTYQSNDIFPASSVSNIVVTVESSPSAAVGDVVTFRIPVALLPMVNSSIVEDGNGDPVSMNWYESHPVHLYYKAAPKEGVAAALTDPTALSAADQQALASYLAANTADDGSVRFYANAFTTDGTTRQSQTMATFRPSSRNDFYRFVSDSVLLTSPNQAAVITPAQWAALGDDTPVYWTEVAYSVPPGAAQGSQPEKTTVYLETTKAILLSGQSTGVSIHAVDGRMVAPAGLYDLSERIENLDMPKCADEDVRWIDSALTCAEQRPESNLTDTDPYARQSTVVPSTGQSVRIRLGNNGWMQYDVPGAFEIAKQVTTDRAGLQPDPDETFAFTVTLSGVAADRQFPYRVFNAQNESQRTGAVASGGTIELTDGQYARVMGLPDGAGYSVAEQDPPEQYEPSAPMSRAAPSRCRSPRSRG